MNPVAEKGLILSNEWVNSEYKHMVVSVSEQASTVEPGQFFNLLCPAVNGNKPFFRRPMSTYLADNQKKQVEFLYKVVGSGTQGLAELTENDHLDFVGPLGKGFTLSEQDKHVVILGRGVGLATLAPLAEYAASRNIKVTALLSAKDKARVMSQHRFLNIDAQVIELLDSDRSSDVVNVEKTILDLHHTMPIDAIFTCGSNRLGKLLQKLVYQLGINGQIALEQNMACGTGICHGCIVVQKESNQLISKQVCKDGPVFNLKEIVL